MYKIELIKSNGFSCNWSTLFVGRILKLITSSDVIHYATEYLNVNMDTDNEYILELAWGHSEKHVDEMLEKIVSTDSSILLEKEYRKWLYSILKEKHNNSSSDELFQEIENLFYLFDTPVYMHEFFRKVSDAYYYTDSPKDTIEQLVEKFLCDQKKLILD
ncbi:DUF2247 family protein [Paenibacillus hunanensis]|uniref:DUF2247 domain-containing protein n=1 Tax=Paenibacillus hunanensis TaxID=539262 RepID=A0ABU1J543_9BACL|nr:DUF2247 family protein [Paenibacillus hunanensis]MDR6246544.1 hypothetical protein [Paenibacillus hunanensis]GGJ31906.1 hypothetical protein GCM10008022_45720 [Paenibacillus hunanensis]